MVYYLILKSEVEKESGLVKGNDPDQENEGHRNANEDEK